MAKKTNTILCAKCLNEFPNKELTWVSVPMHRSNPEDKSTYSIPICKKCNK